MNIYDATNFAEEYLFTDLAGFASTSTSYEVTQKDSADVVLDLRHKIGKPVAINVHIVAILAAGSETYGLRVEDGNVVTVDDVVDNHDYVVLKEVGAAYTVAPTIIMIPRNGFLRLSMIGANTPGWTIISWAAPAN